MRILSVISLLVHSLIMSTNPTFHHTKINDHEYEITLDFKVNPMYPIYRDYLHISVDHPQIEISSWHTDCEPIAQYDEYFKENKQVYTKNFSLTAHLKVSTSTLPEHSYLHCSLYDGQTHAAREEVFPIFPSRATSTTLARNIEVSDVEMNAPSNSYTQQKQIPTESSASFTDYVSSLIARTDSLALRFVFIMLLGLLMSLTPCIYPMIPITVGILQGQSKKSVIHNFLMAFAYTMGIATTFACLGLVAAFTGSMFGSIMANPFVILGIVALLLYLALSMFDIVQLQTPSFLSSTTHSRGGSFISSFMFGAASGTVASPCLSPGLIMILSLVTEQGNPYTGFIYLFGFGLGLSVPLLLIGTFSSSLSVLPQAGMWMIEVKHFFGFLLIGMCFYFLKSIVPWSILIWAIMLFVIIAGIYYLYSAHRTPAGKAHTIKTMIGLALIASSVYISFKAIQSIYSTPEESFAFWHSDYDEACALAQEQHKKIFVDIGAPFCSMCHALDNLLFKDKEVIRTLDKNCILVKLDGSQPDCKPCQDKTFNVIGFPTILLLNEDCTLIKKWGAELYDVKKEAFIDELRTLLQQ